MLVGCELCEYGNQIFMNPLTTKIAVIFLVLLAFKLTNAQAEPAAILLDSFRYSNSEDASARIDILRVALNQAPDNGGYIIVYGGKIGQKGEIDCCRRRF